MRLHRLLGQVEALSDLAVDEAVCHQLEHFDLARGRLLLELPQDGRGERDHGPRPTRATTGRGRFEPATVVTVAVEDLLALSSVHGSDIGLAEMTL